MNEMKKTSEEITVHIADDHQILIDGITAVLDNTDEIKVVGYSLDGEQVLSWFEENEADVLILDIGMPVLDGMDVLRSLKNRNKLPPTVVLTSYNDMKIIKDVLKLGALGFISKISAGESIIEAIKTVHQGEVFLSKDIRNKIINVFSGRDLSEEKKIKYLKELTERELEILRLVSRQMSNKEIAETLFIAVATVETHKKNIMKKLGVKNATGLGMYIAKYNIF